ncbi:unnamed protein product [Symbiodinium sp. CCMP2592]|nr:unnamed protein product [Symbiodinium sp. CCMP2592]
MPGLAGLHPAAASAFATDFLGFGDVRGAEQHQCCPAVGKHVHTAGDVARRCECVEEYHFAGCSCKHEADDPELHEELHTGLATRHAGIELQPTSSQSVVDIRGMIPHLNLGTPQAAPSASPPPMPPLTTKFATQRAGSEVSEQSGAPVRNADFSNAVSCILTWSPTRNRGPSKSPGSSTNTMEATGASSASELSWQCTFPSGLLGDMELFSTAAPPCEFSDKRALPILAAPLQQTATARTGTKSKHRVTTLIPIPGERSVPVKSLQSIPRPEHEQLHSKLLVHLLQH